MLGILDKSDNCRAYRVYISLDVVLRDEDCHWIGRSQGADRAATNAYHYSTTGSQVRLNPEQEATNPQIFLPFVVINLGYNVSIGKESVQNLCNFISNEPEALIGSSSNLS